MIITALIAIKTTILKAIRTYPDHGDRERMHSLGLGDKLPKR